MRVSFRWPDRRASHGFRRATVAGAFLACVAAPLRAEVIDLLASPPSATKTETRQMSFGTGDRTHLVKGWRGEDWDREQDIRYMWANGPAAVLSFDVLDVRDLQFLVRLVSHATDRPQRIRVLVNGVEVSRIDPQVVFLEYRFVVPAKVLRRGQNRLAFRHAEREAVWPYRAAGYASILIGPNCVRLRPHGRPPEPTGVRRDANGLVVRGPAEVGWRVRLPPRPVLELRVATPEEPALLSVAIVRKGAVQEVSRTRVARGLFDRAGERTLAIELPSLIEEDVEVLLGVYPEPCRSAFATTRIFHATIRGNEIISTTLANH